jgi:hypothetical protein
MINIDFFRLDLVILHSLGLVASQIETRIHFLLVFFSTFLIERFVSLNLKGQNENPGD